MDSFTTRQFRDRWLAVAALEDAEQQASTLAERWQQVNRLLAMAMALKLDLTDRQEDAVRLRWAKLTCRTCGTCGTCGYTDRCYPEAGELAA